MREIQADPINQQEVKKKLVWNKYQNIISGLKSQHLPVLVSLQC